MSNPKTMSAHENTIEKAIPHPVVQEGSLVQPEDVEVYLRLREGDERLSRMQEMLGIWRHQQEEERRLRKTYATTLMWFLGVELLLIFVAFFSLGFGLINVQEWVAEVFLVGALTQTSSLVLIIVKYLFRERSADIMKLLEVFSSTAQSDVDQSKKRPK